MMLTHDHKVLLGATIDGSGDLVLTPKKGDADATIAVVLTATDPYMSSFSTPDTGGDGAS